MLKEEGASGRSAISSPAAPLLAPAELRREAVREQFKLDLPSRPEARVRGGRFRWCVPCQEGTIGLVRAPRSPTWRGP